MKNELTVGEMAKRSGVSISTLHFYEKMGLIAARRTAGNQRRYPRGLLRHVAIIRIAQRAGITLAEIKETMSSLPEDRAPNAQEWRRMSAHWADRLTERINSLIQLRDEMQGCIGCGCLSMKQCPLRNPNDVLRKAGAGPVLLD
ncbi:redox-sensitive transcriptional activator SoxR [Martelella sp. AD-3]|uniref:redox-sensitive transcriptional activator SoxR n=1 Tax=Martelella sp. AD-3 TaxID=686597 RepID=UPI0004677317|nr:redox-sensitive transcriptional activator SoxR [Martelella sp. AD-3]AMM84754.1 MerR family transcriptional regulator [Martelella sp. AD-3]MAM13193.1 redox-sensitive transcriptional activator SoxR [Rhizobiaceae bacterium]|tara:strand:+ start:473 stop:904 length:432 start_codon:yes stop_codon:yes gene_type:complete